MQVFVDMDGVLADFDTGYAHAFGPHGGKDSGHVDWHKVRATPGFYATLPPMPDLDILWAGLAPYAPIILTGLPTSFPNDALANKRAWVIKHLGLDVPIIGCRSSDKCLHGQPGDVLIDDWPKYQDYWTRMGGYWITHTSATESLRLLEEYVASPRIIGAL